MPDAVVSFSQSHCFADLTSTLPVPHRVPDSPQQRERIKARLQLEAARLGRSFSINRHSLESLAQTLLQELGYSDEFVPWAMVLLGSAFWKERITAVPFSRRMLLLPHCMRNSVLCPAPYDAEGLHCRGCGQCRLTDLKTYAESLGYTVLIAEGTPVVMQSILSGKTDAILGVGCLKSLERAFEKLQLAGIPAAAVPLLDADCKDSKVDVSWVREMIDIPYTPPASPPAQEHPELSSAPTWLHLLRQAASLTREFLPKSDLQSESSGSLERTEQAAREFLESGGKYYRPFITLAAFDALTGSLGLRGDGASAVADFPSIVKRTALAIEVFHKASLIHDDIEDDDSFRYGRPTLHRLYGVPTAINLGDYLIGLGYRLMTEHSPELGRESAIVRLDILAKMCEAHTKLCEGQGAELFWRIGRDRTLTPTDSLKIYGRKTSPAFEAALYAGIRWGVFLREEKPESDEKFLSEIAEPISLFARYLGIAFQIKNDLEDWTPDTNNKQIAAQDVLRGRPTILGAFALESHQGEDREFLLKNLGLSPTNAFTERENAEILGRTRELYENAGVFDKARLLIDKYGKRAEEIADKIQHPPLRDLLRHLFEPLGC